jgi:tRNA1Val (adenine37-N6)-methyltransferase
MPALIDDLTRDPILRGRLVLWQPRDGYRFSIDPLLLLAFAGTGPIGRACDLGTGCGVIALGLAQLDPGARVTAVELQPRLAAVARKNAVENQLAERVEICRLDLADATAARAELPGASFDTVASNPPYRPLGEGPANPDDESAVARHELRLTLADLAREARRLLVPGGRALVVYPATRLPSLLASFHGEGVRPLRLRLVHGRAHEPARLALLEAKKGYRGLLTVEPPLVLYDQSGYTAEARQLLGDATGSDVPG